VNKEIDQIKLTNENKNDNNDIENNHERLLNSCDNGEGERRILLNKKKGTNRKNRNDKKKEIVSCVKTTELVTDFETKDTTNHDINEQNRYDRIIMSNVIHEIEDYSRLIEMIINHIAMKGVVVICYKKNIKNLNAFFDMIVPLFHSHELHAVEINRENENVTTNFYIHVLRVKITDFR
jgi:hypothetical protein